MPEDNIVTTTKLVSGGQALATLPSGQKVFIWGALPNETVSIRIIKSKRHYAEAVVEAVIAPAPERETPRETNYLSTSPWQIMSYAAENRAKRDITADVMLHEKVTLPAAWTLTAPDEPWHYRNKMEYSFWGDDDGLHLALHQRGSHGKQIVSGSELAVPAVDAAANAVCQQLNQLPDLRAGDLKTIIVRCNQAGQAVGALFTKKMQFPKLTLPPELQGLRVYHSNPKSPASVPTGLLYELGDVQLHDQLSGQDFVYDVDSFFQVNLPIFQQALDRIAAHCNEPILTDMYAGVGSIGLSVAREAVTLVELDPATAAMARLNTSMHAVKAEVVETSSEKALDYITGTTPIIFDPPRAGLHDKVVAQTLEALPPQVIYLSCNPVTQARDLAKLQTAYCIDYFEAFNFFPRTPHIETLAVLHRA